MNALVRLGHELIEEHAALARHRGALEEHIHQHRLAASDIAMDVKALGSARSLGAEGKSENAPRPRPGILQRAVKRSERLGGARLRRVGLELAGLEQRAIALDRRHRRRDEPYPLCRAFEKLAVDQRLRDLDGVQGRALA